MNSLWNYALRAVHEADTTNHTRTTAKESVSAAAKVGSCTMAGAVLVGPVGILIGAVVGAAIAYSTAHPFHGILTLLNNMNEAEREKFINRVLENIKADANLDELLRTGVLFKLILEALKGLGYTLAKQ